MPISRPNYRALFCTSRVLNSLIKNNVEECQIVELIKKYIIIKIKD